MKNVLLLLCCTIIINSIKAQTTTVTPYIPGQSFGFKPKQTLGRSFSDTLFSRYHNQQQFKSFDANIDNMPVTNIGQAQLKYAFSNNGYKVYSASPDNMPVIMPDATFYSVMPIVGSKSSQP
jgi:hypothetical protein